MTSGNRRQLANNQRRFDRGSWATLGCVVAFSVVALAYNWGILRLPGDGCMVDTSALDVPVVTVCAGSWATPLRPGDQIQSVAGVSTQFNTTNFHPPSALPAWVDGAIVPVTVVRDGRMVDLEVPVRTLDFGTILRLTLARVAQDFDPLITMLIFAIVFVLRPRHMVAQILLLLGVGGAVMQIGTWPNDTLAALWMDTLVLWYAGNTVVLGTGWLALPTYLLLVLSFPRRVWPVTRWPRAAPLAIYGGGIAATVASLALGNFAIFLAALGLYTVVVVIAFVAVTAHTLLRVRDPLIRAQTAWIGVGFAVFSLQPLMWIGALNVPAVDTWLRSGYGALVATVGELALPLCLAVAILRYRLFDIEIIIRRTLVYSVLTLTLGATYFIGVVVLQALFVRLTGQESALAVVTSTLAIAALFVPLRRWVQAIIDRRFFRRKYDARQVLEQFALRAQQQADLDALAGDIVQVVNETVQPEQAQVWLVQTRQSSKANPAKLA